MDHSLLDLDETSDIREAEAGSSSPLGLGPGDQATDDFFRSDAKRLGMSVAAYERAFDLGIYQGPREERIEYNEVPVGLTDEDFDIAASLERQVIEERLHKRRHGYKPRRSCAASPSDSRLVPAMSARSSGPRTPRRANPDRACARPSGFGGSPFGACQVARLVARRRPAA